MLSAFPADAAMKLASARRLSRVGCGLEDQIEERGGVAKWEHRVTRIVIKTDADAEPVPGLSDNAV